MKVFIIRLKNIILNLSSFSVLVILFFITKPFRLKRVKVVKKVTWFGAYGNGNLGDDLIFYSLKRLLKNQSFDIKLSIRDLKKVKKYGVPVFVKGEQFYDFGKYIKIIKSRDAVFLGGGGLLEYYYPSKQAFRMIMIYLCPLMIGRIYNKPTFVLGMGVNKGRIENPIVRFVYKHVLSECQFIITRDEKSKKGLVENGVKTKIISSYDPVLSLKIRTNKAKTSKRKIGFLLWPYFLWPHFYENSEKIDSNKQQQHEVFISKINDLIAELQKQYSLQFLTFHFSDTLLYKELKLVHPPKARLDTFIRQVSSLDLLVSMRYHGQITSMLTETPVVALSVQQKMDALMENYDISYYNNSIYDFSVDKVLGDINTIFNKEEQILERIREKNKEVSIEISQVYNSLKFSN